jgi:phospholipid transport system substrate-binding protein
MLRLISPLFFVGIIFFTLVGQLARANTIQAEAVHFIDAVAEKAIIALTNSNITRPERIRRFRRLLRNNFDVNTIGIFVLGRYARSVSGDERKQYLALFERLIVATYVDHFSKYSEETLVVSEVVTVVGKDIIVNSSLSRPTGGGSVRVDWRVRRNSTGELRIIDVIVEGISMGQTQRAEFGSVISKNGGRVSGLIAEFLKMDLPE